MSQSKKELIQAHKEGKLPDVGYATMTNTSGLVISYIDDFAEKVFGYLAGGSAPDYFYVRYYNEGERVYFRVGRLKFYMDEIMRA